MTTVRIEGHDLVVSVEGLHKLWALRRTLTIPLDHVRSATPDPDAISGPKGIRTGGTHVPRIVTAGTFRQAGEKVFWDVRDAQRALVIELQDEEYTRLVLQVDDPRATADAIGAALRPEVR